MGFRKTKGIISDSIDSDPAKEADVIMTAVILGFATSLVADGSSLRFDIDPADKDKDMEAFTRVVGKIDNAVGDYLEKKMLVPAGKVRAGLAADYSKGAVIMGVYRFANQTAPVKVSDPVLSDKGRELYNKIVQESIPLYVGRGAYTGFVDNNNTMGNTDPVGPLSTARFLTPNPDHIAGDDPTRGGLYSRWLPPLASSLWHARLRRGTQDSYVPWGLIGGDKATMAPETNQNKMLNVTGAKNLADQITGEMEQTDKMKFVGNPTIHDIAAYTHGMIQAIYKAYKLGPSCTPYEIPVGSSTTKLASCLPCTLFMVALGYPPTSIHLGRGESWAPLYLPYSPGDDSNRYSKRELAVIRDLNNSWREKCQEWMGIGLQVLDLDHLADSHNQARELLAHYLKAHGSDQTVAATLILDALTIHESESVRINRTLKEGVI